MAAKPAATDYATVNVPIADVLPYVRNPRKNTDAVAKVAASIREFGFRQPIVCDADMVVIAGHTRLQAAQSLGLKTVPVHIARGLSAAQVTAYRLADNRTGQEATWDSDLLTTELTALVGLDFDLALTGFNPDELDALLNPPGILDGADLDDVPEPPAKPIAKVGDLIVMGRHRLLCGDSTKAAEVARLMGGEKAGAVVTDPPYGVSVVKKGMVGANFGVAKKGQYAPIAGDDSVMAVRFLLDLAPVAVVWGGNYFADQLPPTGSWLVWDKRADSGIENTFADCELAWSNIGAPARVYRQLWNGMIREGEHGKREHPTQKPVGLLEWCVGKTEGVVLDPFLGSGSTLIACENASRTCYGIELSPAYCDVIVKRWETVTGEKAVRP